MYWAYVEPTSFLGLEREIREAERREPTAK